MKYEILENDIEFFVRTDGDNSNSGREDSPEGAFKTIQRAVDAASMLNIGNNDVYINIGDGLYTDRVELKSPVGFGTVFIKGNRQNPEKVDLHVTGANCFRAIKRSGCGTFRIQDLSMRTTGSGQCIHCTNANLIELDNVIFGETAFYHITACEFGRVMVVGDYQVVGGGLGHVQVFISGLIGLNGRTITFGNEVHFKNQTIHGYMAGTICSFDTTYLGAEKVHGTRFKLHMNGVLYTNAQEMDYIPGDLEGIVLSGGQYC